MSGTAPPGARSPGQASPGTGEPAAADWQALGTQVWLLVTDPGQLAEARRRLEADLDAVDQACSRFRPDSELMRLTADGPGPATVEVSTVEVSPLLAEAIAVALRAAAMTDGDVDPTVADAMSDLGYDRDFTLLPAVGPPVRLTVRAVPGWRQVGLDEQARLLTLPRGVHLDLGATAKAWAADRAASRLAGALGCGVLVGLGGDISVAGPPPQGGWRIRVQDITGRPEDPPAGGAAVTCCTTSSTRGPACPPLCTGAPCPWPPRRAWTPTRRAPPRSSAAPRLWIGSQSSACQPAWSIRPVLSGRSADGPPRPTDPPQRGPS
jgi:hypothetical protein